MQYLCFIYRHEDNFRQYIFSKENEDLEYFQKQMLELYPYKRFYHHLFYEIKLVE